MANYVSAILRREEEVSVPPVKFEGYIGYENVATGDGRFIKADALEWNVSEDHPIPLMINKHDHSNHGGVVCGKMTHVSRTPSGEIYAYGEFDMSSEEGRHAAHLVRDKFLNGVSMDLRDAELEYNEEEGLFEMLFGGEVKFAKAGIAGAHIVAIPAFRDAYIREAAEFREWTREERNKAADSGVAMPDGSFPIADEQDLRNAIQANGRAKDIAAARAHIKKRAAAIGHSDLIPENWSTVALTAAGCIARPPAKFFTNPMFTAPAAVRITDDGLIYGHLALWDTPHTGFMGRDVYAPHCAENYKYFLLSPLTLDDGSEVKVGTIFTGGPHAPTTGNKDVGDYYASTSYQAATVVVGEDDFGIWVSGMVNQALSDAEVQLLRTSPLSGDWRDRGKGLRLEAILAVNKPGFPIVGEVKQEHYALCASGPMILSLRGKLDFVARELLVDRLHNLSGAWNNGLRV